MAYDEDLAHRLRELLADEDAITEKRMFGGLAFLLHGNMSVSASRNGGLLARIDPADTDAALARPHVKLMEMGGRTMAGWITVAPEGLKTKRDLAAVGQAQRRLREDAAAEVASGEIGGALGQQRPAGGDVGARADDGGTRATDSHQQLRHGPVHAQAGGEQQCGHGHGAGYGAGGEPQHDEDTTGQIHASRMAPAGLHREVSIAPRGG